MTQKVFRGRFIISGFLISLFVFAQSISAANLPTKNTPKTVDSLLSAWGNYINPSSVVFGEEQAHQEKNLAEKIIVQKLTEQFENAFVLVNEVPISIASEILSSYKNYIATKITKAPLYPNLNEQMVRITTGTPNGSDEISQVSSQSLVSLTRLVFSKGLREDVEKILVNPIESIVSVELSRYMLGGSSAPIQNTFSFLSILGVLGVLSVVNFNKKSKLSIGFDFFNLKIR